MVILVCKVHINLPNLVNKSANFDSKKPPLNGMCYKSCNVYDTVVCWGYVMVNICGTEYHILLPTVLKAYYIYKQKPRGLSKLKAKNSVSFLRGHSKCFPYAKTIKYTQSRFTLPKLYVMEYSICSNLYCLVLYCMAYNHNLFTINFVFHQK